MACQNKCRKLAYEYVKGTNKNDKWICIRNFLSKEVQQKYLNEYKQSISKFKDEYKQSILNLDNSKKSFRIEFKPLDFERNLILNAKAFVSEIEKYDLPFHKLDGVALLYGINSMMAEHTDSLSRPHVTNEEWTFTINVGCDVCFKLNGQDLIAHSGDILIMDSRAVMHGVTKIIPNTAPQYVILKNARFGVVFWESAE